MRGAGARPLLIALLALWVSGVACSDDGASPPAASVASDRTTSSTTRPPTTSTTIDVTKVPDEITVEYVQAVMDELDRRFGDLFRMYVEAEGPTQETQDLLTALFAEPEFTRLREGLGQLAAERFEGVRRPPGDPETEVVKLLTASPSCVFVETNRDLDAVLEGPSTDDIAVTWIGLVPKDTSAPTASLNPTAWTLILDGTTGSGGRPADPC